MAIVKLPHIGRTLIMPAEIEAFLETIGVECRRWPRIFTMPENAPAGAVLKAHQTRLENYRQQNNFAGYDLMDLAPQARSAEKTRSEFKREHWHNDFESYFILTGRGICYIHPAEQPVVSVELEPGDLIRIGKYIRHWCDVCPETRFRAVRFLSAAENQKTVYTSSGIETEYETVYMSPAYFAHAAGRLR